MVDSTERWESVISPRLAEVRGRIERACRSVGRDPAGVVLVAVTKTLPVEAVQAAYSLGIRHFGESRLKELESKVPSLPNDAVWHFVGKIQSNKAKRIASIADVLHTVENDRQLAEFAKVDRTLAAFIQVNIDEEQQKSGIFIQDLDTVLSHVLKSYNVRFRGLMAIGRQTPDPEVARESFRKLAGLNRQIGGEWLSMGMSHDFEVALQEGATHIRVGTALFGSR